MKSAGRCIFLLAAILFSGVPLEAQMPSILESRVKRVTGPPFWISAEAVADEEKIIALDFVDDRTLRTIVEEQRQSLGESIGREKSKAGRKPSIAIIPPSECKSEILTTRHRGGDDPSSSLKELTTYSSSIIRGTIRGIELGFAYGEPASLLGVEVRDVIKGPVPKSRIYIDYPVARFKIGPFYFCNGTKGFEPRPGDEVLLFDYKGPVDRDDVLYAPRLDQLLFQNSDGAIFLPTLLKDTPDLKTAGSLDDVVGHIRSGRFSPRRDSR